MLATGLETQNINISIPSSSKHQLPRLVREWHFLAGFLITFHPPHLTYLHNNWKWNIFQWNGISTQQSKNSIYHQLCCRVILLDFLVRTLLLFANFQEKKIKHFLAEGNYEFSIGDYIVFPGYLQDKTFLSPKLYFLSRVFSGVTLLISRLEQRRDWRGDLVHNSILR